MALPVHWWKERPPWLDALHAATAGARGEAEKTGWRWSSQRESRAVAKRVREAVASERSPWDGWVPEEAREACQAIFQRSVPLAHRGGFVADRWVQKLHDPTLWGDPERPEHVWLSLDEGMAPVLWIPAGTSAETLAEAWAPYALPELDVPLPEVLSLPASVRVFLGTEKEIGADLDRLASFFRSLPGADSLPWGTRFQDDPWPDRPEGLARAAAAHLIPERSAQIEGAVPRLTFRSRRLGAAISLSTLAGFHVLEVQYSPVSHPGILGSLRRSIPRMPGDLPPDLPVDALSLLTRCRGPSAAELLAAVRDPAQQEDLGYHAMACVATLGDDGARVRALLREIAARPAAGDRRVAYQIARIVDEVRVLHEALAREGDPENRRVLDDQLRPEIAEAANDRG